MKRFVCANLNHLPCPESLEDRFGEPFLRNGNADRTDTFLLDRPENTTLVITTTLRQSLPRGPIFSGAPESILPTDLGKSSIGASEPASFAGSMYNLWGIVVPSEAPRDLLTRSVGPSGPPEAPKKLRWSSCVHFAAAKALTQVFCQIFRRNQIADHSPIAVLIEGEKWVFESREDDEQTRVRMAIEDKKEEDR
ncbi:hypothetical protein CROQUDRAFT_101321 [Cronartium quercuum f. sp. fusiforme G11]|uniref:Uncharacterized protein n=1 Tax=Cronartium quercuum f. sp. fusiforme G11 TaxID=708437 RepID=A0A9P6N6A1_9BASI|nr:hypothetical protein CROQUDRAFT_101321 [Cronartium quercuum f. sp. fusiforme G11]